MCVSSIMFSLIRSEISSTALDENVKAEITPDLYQGLYELSDKHDVAHLVASALSKAGLLGKDTFSQKFDHKLMMSVYRDTQREYALGQVISALEHAKIPHIPLKGAVIRKYYPEPWMRTSCDIDVLVRKEDTEVAVESLCQAGFLRSEDRSTHDYNFFSPEKVHIELHYSLSQDGEFSAADPVLDRIWSEAIPEYGHSYHCKMPAETFLLYHLVHMGRHLLHGGCGIRPFVDLWLLENKMSYDREKLRSMLENAGLLNLFYAASDLSRVWMQEAEHTELTKLLAGYILSGGVYGTSHNSAHVKAAKGVSKTKSFLSVMFLSKESLMVLYPKLRKHPSLFPLYQIKRWFRIFKKDKRKKIRHLTETRNHVSKTDVDTTKKMLESLGLLH